MPNRLAPALAWTAPGRWSPPPPTLSLAAGTYATEQIVLITSAAPGATLRYTTTGVDPTQTDPEVPANGDVLITGTTTLKARAWVPERAPSVVASATYMLQPAAPTVTPGTGTYVGPQTVTQARRTRRPCCATPWTAVRRTRAPRFTRAPLPPPPRQRSRRARSTAAGHRAARPPLLDPL